MSLLPGARLGPYEIVALLGAGGMGEVYRAFDPRLGRHVAIKILPAEFSDDPDRGWRFEREARAVASLNHPSICTVHDIGEHDGHRYLVMELMEGQPLNERLRAGRIPMPLLLDVAIQIADALDAAHGAGVIHRDLKPANIFLTKRNEAKLLDFGLAKLLDKGGDAEPLVTRVSSTPALEDSPTMASPGGQTTVGTLLGTASYMSPEQARGEPVDAQSDLFSFGVVLYEMATGQRAFSGKTMPVLFDAILNKDPQPITEIDPALAAELARIVEKAMEKERDLRYRMASDVAADLKRLRRDVSPRRRSNSGGQVVETAPGGTIDRAAAPSGVSLSASATPPPGAAASDSAVLVGIVKRHRGVLAIAALLVVVLAGAAAYLLTPDRPSSGDEVSLADLEVVQLTSTGGAFVPALSPDGRFVAYFQADDETTLSVWLRQTDSTSSVRILQGEPGGQFLGATIGPDSRFVDVVRIDSPISRSLWRVPFLGGAPKLVLDRISLPSAWSPDGRSMALVRPVAGREFAVSADGAIAYRSVSENGLWYVDRDGRSRRQLAEGSISYPVVTPDGREVLFASPVGGSTALWRVPVAGGAPTQFADDAYTGIAGFSDVSPDGRSIALRIDDRWIVCELPGCSTRRPIAFEHARPRWTPDGRSLTYIAPGGMNHAGLARIRGGQPLERFVDGVEIGVGLAGGHVDRVDRHVDGSGSAPAPGAAPSCDVHEDAPHHLRGDAEEMAAVLPARLVLPEQPKADLVDEGGRLKHAIRALAGQVARRHAVQLVIDEWQQPLECVLVAVAPDAKQTGDIAI